MKIDSSYRKFLHSSGPNRYLSHKVKLIDEFRKIPRLASLFESTDSINKSGNFDGIDEEIISFLSDDTGFLIDYVKQCVVDLSTDHKLLPLFKEAIEFDNGVFHNVNLTRKFGVSITLSSISDRDIAVNRKNGEATRVLFSGQKVFFKFLFGDDVDLSMWECDPYKDDSDFRTLTCRKSHDIRVSPGDIVEVDGSCQSLSFADCQGTAVFLQVENLSKDIGTSVAFKKSGEFIATYPTNQTALRRMVMCSALKHMGTQERLQNLPLEARQGPFYLRWHFLREMIAALPDEGGGWLADAIERDPNPSIRRAATATLDMLQRRRDGHVA